MQNGFLFDNIYVGHSEKDAEALAKDTWSIKHGIEKENEPQPPQETFVDKTKGFAARMQRQFSDIPEQIFEFMDIARVDFIDAIKTLPHIFAILILSFLVPVYMLSRLFGKSKSAAIEKKEEGSPKKQESKGKSTAVESPKATKRTTKKD
jgi:calnexin